MSYELNSSKPRTLNQSGQVVILLLLVMLTALTVGLTITQRSLTDVSISSKSEQSSRAFSAAEAGIEQALEQCANLPACPSNLAQSLNNQSNATVAITGSLPQANQALEYPPIGRDTSAHFWLVDPNNGFPPASGLSGFTVYFGDPNLDYTIANNKKPAIEVNVVTYTATPPSYKSNRCFFDSDSTRTGGASPNGFTAVSCNGTATIANSSMGANSQFYCSTPITTAACGNYAGVPILTRVRFLYITSNHKIAVNPTGGSLPTQATLITSTGFAGQTQKTIQVFKQTQVIPAFFDYAIFSNTKIDK